MSYEKTNWQVGDTITATKLNKIEDQVAANEEAISQIGTSLMTVTYTYSSETELYTTQATFGEVLEAFENGVTVMFTTSEEDSGYANHQSGTVDGVSWGYNENDEQPYTGGVSVSGSGGAWSVAQPDGSPAQTFEAFCACTLYMS